MEPDVRGDDEDGVDGARRTALRRHGSRGRPYYDLVFDGQELALRENGEAIADWPAVSGRPGMQDGKYQSYRDHGPLPQGRYQFSVGQLQRYDDLSLMQRAIAPLGLGKWRGGTAAWGRHRFWLTPKAGTEAFGRDGFSIHGGTAPGSAGFIDLTDEMDEFADLMQAIGQNDVAVEVDYGWLGSPNHRHKR